MVSLSAHVPQTCNCSALGSPARSCFNRSLRASCSQQTPRSAPGTGTVQAEGKAIMRGQWSGRGVSSRQHPVPPCCQGSSLPTPPLLPVPPAKPRAQTLTHAEHTGRGLQNPAIGLGRDSLMPPQLGSHCTCCASRPSACPWSSFQPPSCEGSGRILI